MSNATDTPRNSGDRRRRRSRGGRNRNDQNQRHDQGSTNSNHSGQGSSRSGGRVRRERKPVQLSWWQKLLKAIGLYKEPSKPKRTREKTTQAPKSNTRNARSSERSDENRSERDDRGERDNRDDRGERDNRDDRGERRERKPARSRKNNRGGDPSTVESARVYLGNLSYDVTEQDLKELFKGVGTVRSVEIVYNRNTHRSKGYGFVEMLHKDDAIRCVEVLHDQPFMGRNLNVSGAKSKEEGDERDDQEPVSEIKASDVELAPLPKETPQVEETVESLAPEVDASEATESAPSAQAEAAPADQTEEAPADLVEEETKQG